MTEPPRRYDVTITIDQNGGHHRPAQSPGPMRVHQVGVQYWHHAPAVFNWNPDIDHSPCPLAWTYQLVRNVLAATVRQDRVETARGMRSSFTTNATRLLARRRCPQRV
jgi:hypothetical protein